MSSSAIEQPTNKSRHQILSLSLILIITILAYWPGLDGPFLFDDTVHISKNTQVHITDLGVDSLRQAWGSSVAPFPASRPLAQLSFGINHAISGLSPFAFKVTNLAIHLVNGCLVFLLSLRLAQTLSSSGPHKGVANPWLPLLVSVLWLLSPLNFTAVLYVVQRMVLLSSFFVAAGLLLYVSGRIRLSNGERSGLWMMLISLPLALTGGLAKESAALFPLLVLAMELTVLNGLPAPARNAFRWIQAVVIWLPLILGVLYLLTHLGLIGYGGRDYTLSERLMTEARVLGFYLQQLFMPMVDRFALQHDDFEISRSVLQPWTTLPAILGLLAVSAWALIQRKRYPVMAFAVLFFLAAHALESTIFPLEMVFEHRNYLAVFAPLFALVWVLSSWRSPRGTASLLSLAVVLLIAYAAVTHLRAREWRSMESMIISTVGNHPDSPRANFAAAKLLIDRLDSGVDRIATYQAARHYLERTRELVPDHLDSLFGLIVLNLHVGMDPEPAWLEELQTRLRNGVVDATKLTTSQFPFLVRWHMSQDTHKLPPATVLAVFEAALANPRHNPYGRAGILSALRAYYDQVLNQPERALPYAEQAIKAWPQRWHYHKRLIELLVKLQRHEEAELALEEAIRHDPQGLQRTDAQRLATLIDMASKDVPSHD